MDINNRLSDSISPAIVLILNLKQGYEGSLLKVTSKNGKTASVSVLYIYITTMMIVCLTSATSAACCGNFQVHTSLCSGNCNVAYSLLPQAVGNRGGTSSSSRSRNSPSQHKIVLNLPPTMSQCEIKCLFFWDSFLARRFRYIPHSCRC